MNLIRYLFTGNRTTLHLPDALHLLLHLLLLHQNIKVALLQLVLRLRWEIHVEEFRSAISCAIAAILNRPGETSLNRCM